MNMKENLRKFIIYKVQNKLNGDTYIGATTKSVNDRKLDHIQKANNGESTKFYVAIRTYDASAFNWEQIDTASSLDELAQKEKQYITEFKSKEEGYNSDEGGGFQKTIYQYNLEDGSLINTYDCLTDAGNAVNATKQCISKACLSVNHTYRGFYWSYDYKEPFIPKIDERKKEVLQYSLEGHLLSKYLSVADASKQTGVVCTSIAKVCRGERKSAGGFVWSYN